ncbi:ABC transporter ATP-binding protein [Pedobacter heparinus]|uniref:ABC transporter related n=1 Tax=Pedobacter heparinus (strain ATCC 13125 / DSM 2366 / CIP 104194 / JCM 7457 / NBRC 12017 / NCIMB 9290 / NRRL B-14731 / HIM 762-3) TaxID=485917 RepID=C6XXG2_PEDHD|nr:ATP-binding cassette domain-containing protein [Pedobacter heparinus]ACU06468.1 ABC transporter related [Pedobacter heparinus DSM 2366]
MTISLQNVGRRFNQEWIFRGLDYTFNSAGKYAVLGPNGSGKSTLLSVLLGNLGPSEGKVVYEDGAVVPVAAIYKYISFAAPYLDLIEEFTLQETIDFHFKVKGFHAGMDAAAVLELLGLSKAQDKALKYFSSGMKQRTKLVLACCADTPLLFLDEPTSNLDKQGLAWYLELIERFALNRTLIIGSNQEVEYSFCNHFVQLTDYK